MKKILLLMSAVVLAAAFYFYGKADTLRLLSFVHIKEDVKNEIKIFGNVEMRHVLLGFRVPGRVEKMFFEEGISVEEGTLLGELDPVPYEIKLAEAKASLLQSSANLQKMKSGNRFEEIEQAASKRNQIRASLELAEKDYARLAHLYSQNAIAKNDFDKITASRDSLRAELASSESALALMREGFRSEDIKVAEAAQELAEAKLKEAETSLSDTKLYSPSQGTILTRVAEPGTVLGTGVPIYSIMLDKPVQVRAYIGETQLGRIKLGMKGKVYTDSWKDPVEGVVNFISSEAEFTPKQVQTEDLRTSLVYRIRLLIEDSGGKLKNGMPVTVIFQDME